MRLFVWPVLVVAVAYSALITWLLIHVSRDSDPEAQTAGWIIFGLPWSAIGGFFGRYYWLVVPLNALTLYFGIVLGSTLYRKFRVSK
jgi:hypothetical protein